jgi:protein phosphatase 1 regulatory subunit 11
MQREREPPSASRTQVVEQVNLETVSITLQPLPPPERPVVRFDESIIDNEHLNRKKSKICCIYRKPYDPNCSSSESDSEAEKEAGNSYDVQLRKKKAQKPHQHCSH